MGLDISAYSEIKLQKQFTEDYTRHDYYENDDNWDYTVLYNNKHFPIQYGNLIEGAYSYDDKMEFRAGSYRGYNAWRNRLAVLAGYGSAERVWQICNDYTKAQGEDSYDMPSDMPFIEIINFSDCEGVICSEIAKKLLNDFKTFDEKAKESMDGYSYERYQSWTKAFELASNNGAVSFH